MPSSRVWTPMFFKLEPTNTGSNDLSRVHLRSVEIIISLGISSPSKYSSVISSEKEATLSISFSFHSAVKSIIESGISCSSIVLPWSDTLNVRYFSLIRSIIPLNELSAPTGIKSGTGSTPSFFFISSSTAKKLAPILSILFTKAILGTE